LILPYYHNKNINSIYASQKSSKFSLVTVRIPLIFGSVSVTEVNISLNLRGPGIVASNGVLPRNLSHISKNLGPRCSAAINKLSDIIIQLAVIYMNPTPTTVLPIEDLSQTKNLLNKFLVVSSII
jgi:hypothetical protein